MQQKYEAKSRKIIFRLVFLNYAYKAEKAEAGFQLTSLLLFLTDSNNKQKMFPLTS